MNLQNAQLRQTDLYSSEPVPLISFKNLLNFSGITLNILRLDQVHPQISGNKWYKLRYNLAHCLQNDIRQIVSFGGAWSNHLHALAAAGSLFNLNTLGLVRGYESAPRTPTLQDAEKWGMRIIFLNRQQWREKADPELIKACLKKNGVSYDDCLIIPEGGSNLSGCRGCLEIFSDNAVNPSDYDHIVLAAGTGATFAGMVAAAKGESNFLGIPVLKGGGFLNESIGKFLRQLGRHTSNWRLDCNYHCGGYGKTTESLMSFIHAFQNETGIVLDRVYTGKTLFALSDYVKKGKVAAGSNILAIHTGGLQGNRPMPAK